MKKLSAILKKLTVDDLRDWAGAKIFGRGQGYIGNVDQLSRTADDGLAAWVSGSEEYATSVKLGADGDLEGFCTCPYDGEPCKHAVAVVLAAARAIKQGLSLPLLAKDDDLYLTLLDDEDPEDDAWPEEDDEDVEEEIPVRAPGRKGGNQVAKILAAKGREELLGLLVDLAGHHPEVARRLIENEQLAGGQVDKIVRALRLEIKNLTAEPAWSNHWNGEGNQPDYSHVRQQLRALLAKGHADQVLQLGEELWRGGNSQVAESDDEGECAMAISDCLAEVLRALPNSSLAPVAQLLWVIDRQLQDEYGLLAAGDKIVQSRAYTQAHWREVAEVLTTRLQAQRKPRTTSFSDTYPRGRLLDRVLEAYGRSGEQAKIIPLLEKEAEVCRCYGQLAEALLAAGDRERARQWCIKGFIGTAANAPGIAGSLQKKLRSMAEEEKRHDLVAAYRAEDFFAAPSRQGYTELRRAAEKIKVWPEVRAGVLGYLQTGQRPNGSGRGKKVEPWPLPPPEVQCPPGQERRRFERFPDLVTLIDIAILEERLDDVVELYAVFSKGKPWVGETGKEVAKAVRKSHPQVALDIWRAIADNLIGQVKPRAYEDAAVFLRLMHKVYVENNRLTEWQALLNWLRVTHKAKRRLLEVLDSLSGKKKLLV